MACTYLLSSQVFSRYFKELNEHIVHWIPLWMLKTNSEEGTMEDGG
jgi:hypothetical protein